MITRALAFSLSSVLLFSGCATAEKSTMLGAGVGSAVGLGLGALISNKGNHAERIEGALIGLGLGGLLGALIGNQLHKEQGKKDQEKNFDVNAARIDMFGSASDQDKRPTLKPAQVKVRYVEDQIKDGIFIPAHFEYEISSPAQWEKSK